jgi:hypothetical protein
MKLYRFYDQIAVAMALSGQVESLRVSLIASVHGRFEVDGSVTVITEYSARMWIGLNSTVFLISQC